MGLADLVKIAGSMPTPLQMEGLQGSAEGFVRMLERMTLALETLVELESPLTTGQNFLPDPNNLGPFNWTQFGPTSMVSRIVDVYNPSFNTIGFQVRFLDPNMQPSAFTPLIFYPGDFRSFAIRSRGFQIWSGGTCQFQVSYFS